MFSFVLVLYSSINNIKNHRFLERGQGCIYCWAHTLSQEDLFEFMSAARQCISDCYYSYKQL